MKSYAIQSFFLLLMVFWIGCASQPISPIQDKKEQTTDTEKLHDTDSNYSTNPAQLIFIDKKFFTIYYDPQNYIARYVEYTLTSDNLERSFVKRKDRFHRDTHLINLNLPTVGPKDYDYKNSGYQRGHLAPSGDFEWSEEANHSTFTMANMAPQRPNLNMGAWAGLEGMVREWACFEGKIRVVTGPIIDSNLSNLPSGIVIPTRFFKAILDDTPPRKTIGFIMNQIDRGRHIYKERVASVREIESLVQQNFFSDLPSEEQDRIEVYSNLEEWRGKKCKGASQVVGSEPTEINFAPSSSGNICPKGELKSANIQRCCSHHGGVMGPKNYRACCSSDNKVLCNDGTASPTCRCN